MAVSVFTAGMFKPMLKLVTPAIDLKNFVTYIYEEKTCAICGRKFRARLFVKNANPNNGSITIVDLVCVTTTEFAFLVRDFGCALFFFVWLNLIDKIM